MAHVKCKIKQESDLVRPPPHRRPVDEFADRRDVVAIEAKLGDDYEPKDKGVKVADIPVINAYRSPENLPPN